MSQIDAAEKVELGLKPSSIHETAPESRSNLKNADGALQMLEEGLVLGDISSVQNKHLLRRIDFYIMPLICMYVIAFFL